jgi:hypothetical protein
MDVTEGLSPGVIRLNLPREGLDVGSGSENAVKFSNARSAQAGKRKNPSVVLGFL